MQSKNNYNITPLSMTQHFFWATVDWFKRKCHCINRSWLGSIIEDYWSLQWHLILDNEFHTAPEVYECLKTLNINRNKRKAEKLYLTFPYSDDCMDKPLIISTFWIKNIANMLIHLSILEYFEVLGLNGFTFSLRMYSAWWHFIEVSSVFRFCMV